MKNLTFSLLITIITLGFVSCEKEVPEPATPQTTVPKPSNDINNLFDKDWILAGANFYTPDSMLYYNHPSVSCLNPFYGGVCSFDTLKNGITTWRFTAGNSGNFYLNGIGQDPDNYTLTKVANDYVITVGVWSNSVSITRPIEIISVTTDRLEVKVGELGSIIGVPYTILVFRKANTNISNTNPTIPYGYNYGGVINNVVNTTLTLNGTTWVVTKIQIDNPFFSETPDDTLSFVSNTLYDITYKASNVTTLNNTYSAQKFGGYIYLTLNNYTKGSNGYWYGKIPEGSITSGVIMGAQFADYFNNQHMLISMVKQ